MGVIDPEEMREWLANHEATPPAPCLLCEEPVAKDTVIDHMLTHEPWQVAMLVGLVMFIQEDES